MMRDERERERVKACEKGGGGCVWREEGGSW